MKPKKIIEEVIAKDRDAVFQNKLKRTIRRVVRAEVGHAWRGASDCETKMAIERELKSAWTKLSKLIEKAREVE